jgi:hypothetical protein
VFYANKKKAIEKKRIHDYLADNASNNNLMQVLFLEAY